MRALYCAPVGPAIFDPFREEAKRLGVVLDDRQVDLFIRYLDLLLVWNRKINLTAISEPSAILEKHFLDSLAIVPFLSSVGRLIDVGSGAGFPGIPVAIAEPRLEVTLLEATAKKTAFLRAAIHALGLSCKVVDERLESFASRHEGPFDYAVARATFPPREWLKRASGLLQEGGRAVVMTGREDLPPPGSGFV